MTSSGCHGEFFTPDDPTVSLIYLGDNILDALSMMRQLTNQHEYLLSLKELQEIQIKIELTLFAFSLFFFTLQPEPLSALDTKPLLGQPFLPLCHQVSIVSTPH